MKNCYRIRTQLQMLLIFQLEQKCTAVLCHIKYEDKMHNPSYTISALHVQVKHINLLKRQNHICVGYTRQSCNLPSLFLFKERNENKWMLNTCTNSQTYLPILLYKQWKELHTKGSGCLFVSLLESPSPFHSVCIAYWLCAHCRWINSLSRLNKVC